MKTIVLIEDDAAIRGVFALGLSRTEYQVQTFENGDKVLSKAIETPGLFVLDKNISGTNGMDLCRYIKSSEQYGQVPVIIISASPDLEMLAGEAGADGVISKPFSLKILRQTIARFLR